MAETNANQQRFDTGNLEGREKLLVLYLAARFLDNVPAQARAPAQPCGDDKPQPPPPPKNDKRNLLDFSLPLEFHPALQNFTLKNAIQVKTPKPNTTPKPRAKRKRVTSTVKRPTNSFLLYSNKHRPLIHQQFPALSNAEVSKRLGQSWKELSEDEKAPFKEKAARIKAKFDEDHPDYKFTKRARKPKKKEVWKDICSSVTTSRAKEINKGRRTIQRKCSSMRRSIRSA
mmetsp:Transcript_12390/g.13708  ORF Transcript_12390/g.13708 Transcript_12390/m.13708 type:complete len:229 (+) Transcript_12390:802-1488(+)